MPAPHAPCPLADCISIHVMPYRIQIVSRQEGGFTVRAKRLDLFVRIFFMTFRAFEVGDEGVSHIGALNEKRGLRAAPLLSIYFAISVARVSRITVTRI